jgi:hypothetical protein
MQKAEGSVRSRDGRLLILSAYLLAAALCLAGCAKDKESAQQRSENTLRDPMRYSPQFEKTDVSGGGLLDYDRDGMRKDMKNVLDP